MWKGRRRWTGTEAWGWYLEGILMGGQCGACPAIGEATAT